MGFICKFFGHKWNGNSRCERCGVTVCGITDYDLLLKIALNSDSENIYLGDEEIDHVINHLKDSDMFAVAMLKRKGLCFGKSLQEEATKRVTDQAQLAAIVRNDGCCGAMWNAAERLFDQTLILNLYETAGNFTRIKLLTNLSDKDALRKIALTDEFAAMGAVKKLVTVCRKNNDTLSLVDALLMLLKYGAEGDSRYEKGDETRVGKDDCVNAVSELVALSNTQPDFIRSRWNEIRGLVTNLAISYSWNRFSDEEVTIDAGSKNENYGKELLNQFPKEFLNNSNVL